MDIDLKKTEEYIFLKVQNRHGISFNDKVLAITSYNERGVFDVLPKHENFISIIKNKLIIHQMDGTDKEIKLDSAILRVYRNEANVFLGIIEV
jgi:F0F1-type ATP synthase epsilon subunit